MKPIINNVNNSNDPQAHHVNNDQLKRKLNDTLGTTLRKQANKAERLSKESSTENVSVPNSIELVTISSGSSDSDNDNDSEYSDDDISGENRLSTTDGLSQGETVYSRREQIYEVRYYLKQHGINEFIKHFLPQNASIKDIIRTIESLGYSVNNDIDTSYIYNLLDYLHIIFKKVLKTRSVLRDFYSIGHVIQKLKSCNKIIIITGAGISTSLGIPDFRSSKGLYSQLTNLGLSDPQEVFDLDLFHTDPTIFYSVANKILPPKDVYTPLHSFIKLLDSKNKLLRNYTQNIDNVEANAGISADKIVQCHGSFATATCVSCKYHVNGDVIRPSIEAKVPSYCPKCKKQRSRMEKGDQYFPESFGVFKPDITFFGEDLPERFQNLIRQDLVDCDLLISIGTSLQVAPVGDIVERVPAVIPQVLINRDPIPRCNFDVSFLGDCDEMAVYLCRLLGWDLQHPKVKEFGALNVRCLNEYEGLYKLEKDL